MAVHVLGQVCRWIHHGFREGSFHAGTEAVGVILSNPPIRHQCLRVSSRILADQCTL